MSDRTPVDIMFQGPDWSASRPDDHPDEIILTFESFDLDYGCITVDHDLDEGHNWTLAEPAPMCNENGDPLGEIGWRIAPDEELLRLRPDLHKFLGFVFGRVIVTSAGPETPVARSSTYRDGQMHHDPSEPGVPGNDDDRYNLADDLDPAYTTQDALGDLRRIAREAAQYVDDQDIQGWASDINAAVAKLNDERTEEED